MRWYIDASIALHALLPGGDLRARRWLDAVAQSGDEVFSSMLLNLESTRALRREALDVSMARPLLDRVNLVSIDDGVLRFPPLRGRIDACTDPTVMKQMTINQLDVGEESIDA